MGSLISIVVDIVVLAAIVLFLRTLSMKIKRKKEHEAKVAAERIRKAEEQKKWAEEQKRLAEEREQNTLRYKCPYCGMERAEYPAKSTGMLRACDNCFRHFYPLEDQTPRSPEDADIVRRELMDLESLDSAPFYKFRGQVADTIYRNNSGYIILSSEGATVNKFYFFGGEVDIPYPTLETKAGLHALAKQCTLKDFRYYVSIDKPQLGSGIKLYWHRRED